MSASDDFPSTSYTCDRDGKSTRAACGAAPLSAASAAAQRAQTQLSEANACAQSSITVGANILADLSTQRETLMNANDTMQGTTGALQARRSASGPVASPRLIAADVTADFADVQLDFQHMLQQTVAAHVLSGAAAHAAAGAGTGGATVAAVATSPHRRAVTSCAKCFGVQ